MTTNELHIHFIDDKVSGVEVEGQIYSTSSVISNPLYLQDNKVEKNGKVLGN